MLSEFGGAEPKETPIAPAPTPSELPIGNPEDEQGTSKLSDDENILIGKEFWWLMMIIYHLWL